MEVCSDKTDPEQGASGLLADIIKTVSASEGFFRHQQKDEADLTVEQKSRIASDLLATKPAIFLARFGRFLTEDQLEYFDGLEDTGGDYELQFYLKQARQAQCRFISQKTIKNRRYSALRNMLETNDEYFSNEAMKARHPLLH